ncbi:hypothetical protein BLOT_006369 [Blomia tropicalis]|nr:hypothetical protein BLOT_006369 [Blomia tropicalis]
MSKSIVFVVSLLFAVVCLIINESAWCRPLSSSTTIIRTKRDQLDQVENIARLLIQLDEDIDRILGDSIQLDHFYFGDDTPLVSNGVPNNGVREEKFSAVLQDLNKIEENIKEAITKANANRQYRLVMRLRPLLSYVNHIHRNMEMLRTRVVAIATLSNLSVTVTEVLDQFGDVMTGSMGLTGGNVPVKEVPPKDAPNPLVSPAVEKKPDNTGNVQPESTKLEAKSTPSTGTTSMYLSSTPIDADDYLKKIINPEKLYKKL